MALRDLPQHALANRASCSYFVDGFAPNNTIRFQGVFGKSAERAMIGFKTGRNGKRYWHFAFSCRVICRPMLACVVRAHVVFSDDAKTLWSSASRLHRARRSQCKNWWNPVWRDRILAAVSWLADAEGMIRLPVADGLCVEVCTQPVRFRSPVSYVDPQAEADSALPPEPAGEEDFDAYQLDEMEDDDDEDEDATPADVEGAEG
jgi:hypothetical protein